MNDNVSTSHEPVPLRLVEVDLPYEEKRRPGAAWFKYRMDDPSPVGLVFACPCGCGHLGAVNFAGKRMGSPEWQVYGTWPKVTLQPSIGFRLGIPEMNTRPDGYHWHGWLRSGMFESA